MPTPPSPQQNSAALLLSALDDAKNISPLSPVQLQQAAAAAEARAQAMAEAAALAPTNILPVSPLKM